MYKKNYVAPVMEVLKVELEKGFMSASVFDPDDKHDKGVSIKEHEFGNSMDFSDDSWE